MERANAVCHFISWFLEDRGKIFHKNQSCPEVEGNWTLLGYEIISSGSVVERRFRISAWRVKKEDCNSR